MQYNQVIRILPLIVMFAPFTDEHVINQLSVNESINGINIHVVVIGQG
jgi:hypothetical protein